MRSLTVQETTSRAGVYRLLGRLWIREIDQRLLQQLHSPQLRDALVQTKIHLPEPSAETIETLSVDYCQLFVGPSRHLPPFQSVWQSGQFHGTTSLSMRRYTEVVGYVLNESISEVCRDHLGVQFDVMAHILASYTAQAEQMDQHEALREIENSFFAAHLRWPTALLDAAEAKATTDFYQSLVAFTRQFLDSEARQENGSQKPSQPRSGDST